MYSQGWGAVNHDLGAYGANKDAGGTELDGSGPNSPVAGSAPPADLVAAFLQSHRSNAAASTIPHDLEDHRSSRLPSILRSSSINSDADGETSALLNPFAINSNEHSKNSHYPNLQHPQQQHAGVQGQVPTALQQQQQQQVGRHQQQQSPRKKRSFLRRLFRGLMITSASAGLMALGAWGGSLAYRHYMSQLDDRDQLARRVAYLQKQEEKLVLRCTALEQDRQNLTAQLSDAGTALSDNSAARSKLQQQLSHAQAEREETVRLNLNLQRKLSVLEEQHAALSSVHKEKLQALDLTLAEAARLDKEVGKLMGSLEKLESRCGALEAANVELKRENASLAAAQQKNKMHKA